MKFELDKSNQGEWFTYFDVKTDDDGENKRYIFSKDGDQFCIRKPAQELFDKVDTECRTKKVEQVFNKKTKQMERQVNWVDQTPEQKAKQLELTADWTFVDWNVKDDKGDKIPLTLENKVKMMKLQTSEVDMNAFVVECWKLKSEADAREKEDLTKN